MKFKDYVDKIVAKADPKQMYELTCVLSDHFDELLVTDPKMYWEVIHDLHVLVNGYYFDEECALYAVSQFKNEDGTMGQHWAIADTTSVAQQNGITFDKFTPYDWYYVLNMVYSDYYPLVGTSVPNYIQMAKLWIMDKDAPEGKAYRYYMALR